MPFLTSRVSAAVPKLSTLNNTTPVSINKTLAEHLSSMLFLNFDVLISTDTKSKAEFKMMIFFALFVFTLLK